MGLFQVFQDVLVEFYRSRRVRFIFGAVVSGPEFLEPPLIETYVYCPIVTYCIYIIRTSRCVVAFIELQKQNMPDMILYHFYYIVKNITR